jgi:hypothetical protein
MRCSKRPSHGWASSPRAEDGGWIWRFAVAIRTDRQTGLVWPVKARRSTLRGGDLIDICSFTARPQGCAGSSRCPQVRPTLCSAPARTGTLGTCGSWFPRRRPSSSLPWPCRPPQLFLTLAHGYPSARHRSARHLSARHRSARHLSARHLSARHRSARLGPAWRASTRSRQRAPTRRAHGAPGLRRTRTSPGLCPPGPPFFDPSTSPATSGLQLIAASTCWRPWDNRCSARETASWPSRASSQAEEFSPFSIPMGSARRTSRLISAWRRARSFAEAPRSVSSPTSPDTASPFTAFIGGPSPEMPTGIPCHC